MTHPSPRPNPNASTDLSTVSAECTLPETFSVDDPTSANWVVRKIIEARNYAQHVKEWAEAECKRAQNEEQFFLFHYGIQLERWAKSEIDGSRRKCVKLPGGTVGFRTESRKLDVADEQKLIAWCRDNLPDALKIETHVLKSLVKDHVQNTGECPDGTNISGGSQKFYIR
ncbi:MAG TPA: host-nuclease inhibitor Gam family protein [Tepidisphaeraceae bacterium]|jgi:hypothetical protein